MKGSSRKRGIAITTLAVAFWLAACASNEEKPTACTPGDSKACVGPGVCAGGQVCRADGSGYGPCDCGGTDGGAGAAGAAGSASNCPSDLPGPDLVEVPLTAGGSFCIDATEVTVDDYSAFLGAGYELSKQVPECAANIFTPKPECAGAQTYVAGDFPVGCVDWCDAKAYCDWAGKRLCGRVGGGVLDIVDAVDAKKSQWFAACSANGTNQFPYGDTERPECDPSGPGELATVKAFADCQGGYQGIFGMYGNAEEWVDSCQDVPGGACRKLGSSFGKPCDDSMPGFTNEQSTTLSFRCCYDVPSQP